MVWDIHRNAMHLATAAHFNCKELAKLNHVSVRQLQRVFHKNFRRTPQEWLNEQRILAVKQALLQGDSVKKVALEMGFKHSSHLCRQFKMLTGTTPSQFKNPPL